MVLKMNGETGLFDGYVPSPNKVNNSTQAPGSPLPGIQQNRSDLIEWQPFTPEILESLAKDPGLPGGMFALE